MHLAPNTLLQGRYRVQHLIAQGGMGAVYRAVDERLGHTVALKQTLMTDPQLRAAFEQEARLLAGLHHAALPVVSDHFAEADGEFLVMQFIAGADLAEEIQQRGAPFVVADVLAWADRLLDALDYLHTQQPPIIHRDIKPQNVKITQRNEPILLDFGLAKGVAADAKSIAGYTPRYAPLEQIRGSGTEPRSDLYALAATLYELLTAQAPPDALTRAAAAVASQADPLVPAYVHNPDVPIALGDLLTSALALDPERRPPSAAAMRSAVRDLTRSPPSSAGAATVVMTPQAPTTQARTPPPPPPPAPPTAVLPSHAGALSSRGILAVLFGLGTLAVLACGALWFALNTLVQPEPDRARSITAAPIAEATIGSVASTAAPAQAPSAPAQAEPTSAPVLVESDAPGTRAAPFPPDALVPFGGWQVGIIEIIRGEEAWQRVRAANQFNKPPPDGMEYVLLRLDLRTTTADAGERQLYPKLVGEHRIEYASSGVAPEPRITTTLPGNTQSEGYIPFLVGAAEANLLLKLDQLSGPDDLEPAFIALEPGSTLPDDPALAAIEPNQLGVDHREPAPLGTTAILEDWEVTVREVIRGDAALERLSERSSDFERPVADREYALVYLTARSIGTQNDSVRLSRTNIDSVLTDDPNTPPGRISSPSVYLLPEPVFEAILFPGGVAEGWVIIELPVAAPGALVFRSSFLSRTDDPLNTRYLALE
jgi:hypothetical protein